MRPTQHGIAIVDPESLGVVTQPPRVAIESITLDTTDLGLVDRVTIKPGQTNLEIQYTALSYSKPEQITFRHKVDGVDDAWQDAGNRRSVQYARLPAGHHLFRVVARNSDGVVSTSESTVAITVIPPFSRPVPVNECSRLVSEPGRPSSSSPGPLDRPVTSPESTSRPVCWRSPGAASKNSAASRNGWICGLRPCRRFLTLIRPSTPYVSPSRSNCFPR